MAPSIAAATKVTLAGPDIPALTFFGDSSSHNLKYMVAGGFAVGGSRIHEVESHIAKLRGDAGIQSEFHWSAYRGRGRAAAYEALVSYAFTLIKAHKAALHLIIVKFDGYNHRAQGGEDRSTSVNRMYYQLCLHRLAQYYGKKRAIHVRLDAGNDSKDICLMRNQVCADAYKRYSTRPNCIRSIEPVQSEKSGIVQMADVIIGGVAAHMNEVQHTSAKGALADFILSASGRPAWGVATPPSERFLTVWPFGKK